MCSSIDTLYAKTPVTVKSCPKCHFNLGESIFYNSQLISTHTFCHKRYFFAFTFNTSAFQLVANYGIGIHILRNLFNEAREEVYTGYVFIAI